MKPGIYDGISNADYHGGPGISNSTLALLRKSPAHCREKMLMRDERAANDNASHADISTPAQITGTAFHCMILEPAEFVKNYCLALRPADVPEAVADKDVLLGMIAELNATRKPKMATSGSKAELVERINAARVEDGLPVDDGLATAGLADLKTHIAALNETRMGLLSTTGTMEGLAQTLRDAGRALTLWSDVKAQWMANNGHRQVLTQDAWDQLHRMRDAVMAHPAASALLSVKGVAERSVYWVDPDTGLLCRCRPDFWRVDGIVVDVKTTEDASLDGFAHSISKWGYHVQHPFYLDGINTMRTQYAPGDDPFALPVPVEARAFVFLAVEKSACVVDGVAKGVAVYVLDQESVALGRAEYRRDLDAYAQCDAAKHWPGYGEKIQSISVPQWKLVKNAELLAEAA